MMKKYYNKSVFHGITLSNVGVYIGLPGTKY